MRSIHAQNLSKQGDTFNNLQQSAKRVARPCHGNLLVRGHPGYISGFDIWMDMCRAAGLTGAINSAAVEHLTHLSQFNFVLVATKLNCFICHEPLASSGCWN